MTVRQHSRFAPSSLERVLACPRSVLLAEALGPERHASKYAAEGSVAHMIAELHLEGGSTEAPGACVGSVIEHEGYEIVVDQDMHTHAAEYTAYVRELMKDDSVLFIEQTVRLDAIVGPDADMYGHLDAAVWSPSTGVLDIIDYKYGAGVKVSPLDNPQLKAYALGAMFSIEGIDPAAVEIVRLHVFQPRIPPALPPDVIPAVDLMLWGSTELEDTVARIMNGEALHDSYITGDHCRWCPALAHCPAMRDRAMQAAQKAFADPPIPASALTTDELAVVLDEIDVIEPFFDAVRDVSAIRAIEDHDVPRGRKVVQGKSTRAWIGNPLKGLQRLKFKKADLYDAPKMKSVAQVEKLVKAKKSDTLTERFNTLWERKPGGFTLVKDTDPRPETHAATAEDVFARVPLPADLTDYH